MIEHSMKSQNINPLSRRSHITNYSMLSKDYSAAGAIIPKNR